MIGFSLSCLRQFCVSFFSASVVTFCLAKLIGQIRSDSEFHSHLLYLEFAIFGIWNRQSFSVAEL